LRLAREWPPLVHDSSITQQDILTPASGGLLIRSRIQRRRCDALP
jgi:hypothetical protein